MSYEEVEEAVMDELITKTEAIELVTGYLKKHLDGCAWGMSARETAELIFDHYWEDEDEQSD